MNRKQVISARRKASRYLRIEFTQEYLNLELDEGQVERNMRERLQKIFLDGYRAGLKASKETS